MFLSYFYTPLIDKYTREDKKKGTATLLDNIYTNTTHIVISMKTGILKLLLQIIIQYLIIILIIIFIASPVKWSKCRYDVFIER